ncbi:hypothetical protein KJ762_08730 [bacterium]|nr:hypothetical protein [bacterium]MBU1634578.1 hypothetical protein [bacterium]
MFDRNFILKLAITFVLGFMISINNCDTGIELSPDAGILRITLQSDPSDTSIVKVTDTLYVSQNDSLSLKIFQGKVYKDTVYTILYKEISSYKQEEITYNIIKRDSTGYKRFTIFESFVPPLDYDRIRFGITSDLLEICTLNTADSTYDISTTNVQPPEGANLFVDLYQDFYVSENDTTEIDIQIKSFKSISRYKDSYQFIPDVSITNVIYH